MSTRLLIIGLVGAMLSFAAIPSYLVQTFAGSDFIGDGGPATQALLATVQGVAVDPLGNYYIADTDAHRIRRISPSGIITTVAGTGQAGFSGDGGPATLAQLNLPYGLAADFTGNIYVADFGNHCVRKISPNGGISTVAGLAPGTQMSGPRNLAVDASGNIYISDFIASRVYRLSPQGAFTAYAGSTSAAPLGDNGPATLARLANPAGLAIDLAGNLYIADSGNKRIRRVSGGIITSLNVPIVSPIGLTIDYAKQLYVADAGAGVFLRITNLSSDKPTVVGWPEPCRDVAIDPSGNVLVANGNTVKLFNGSSFAPLAGGGNYLFAGDDSSALAARLNRPLELARDFAGNIYIADSANHRIRRITPDGIIHTFLEGLSTPAGLAFDSNTSNLYIADAGSHAILLLKPDGTLTTLVSNGQGYAGDGGPASAAQLNGPSALAFDANTGTLYVSDEGNNRIRKVTADGKIQTVATLQGPAGLALDSSGQLYAAESGAGRIVRIQPSGLADSISNAGIWLTPRGIAFDFTGALYVTDVGTQRITRIDPDGTVSLAAGTGAQGYGGDSGPGTSARFDTPSAIVADANGVIYVSDTGNNRVRTLTVSAGIAAPVTTPLQLISAVNAASRLVGPVAAGELIAIIGTGVETDDLQINSIPVKPFSTSPGEAIVALPDDLGIDGTVEIQVLTNGIPQARVTSPVAQAAPGVYPAMIFNEDGTANSALNPAARGSAITIYGTGEGRSGLNMTATLDGQQMDVASFCPSVDTPGMFVLTAYVPAGYFPAGMKKLFVSAGLVTSQAGVTVTVR